MAAFTSKATGNWSASGQTTWNEVGVPGSGDTVSIGAHTVTVDVNTTVGTSPNDATTKVVDLTSASSILKVAAGITLTVLGNRGSVNGSTFQQEAGSTVTFDASASGGSPIYTDVNGGFQKYVFNGTVGNMATIQAISGQRFKFNANWNAFTATYTTFRRCNIQASNAAGGATGTSITNCAFDACGAASIAGIDITQASATLHFTFLDNVFTGTIHATDSLKLNLATTATTSVRTVSRNVLDKSFTDLVKDLIMESNVMGGISCSGTAGNSTFAKPPRNNFLFDAITGGLNGGNGMLVTGSWERNYCVINRGVGNAHFLAPQAKNAVDETHSQWIFESQEPDLVDVGDCFLMLASATSGGNKVVAKNCLVLQSGYTGATVTSGTLLTVFSTTTAPLFDSYRGTVNVNNSSVGGAFTRGAFAFAEGSTGAAGQVTVLKSNLIWGSASSQGYVGERVSGNVKDIVTAAGVDKNWTYNTSIGDNQRGYEDRAASNAIWTAGDAVAAAVDANQGTGNPQFHDGARNLAAWATARGYGSTYANALTALQAIPSRVGDLIAYVFEGFRPTNAACRNAAHDGGCVGAANFAKTARVLTAVTTHRGTLSKFGIS